MAAAAAAAAAAAVIMLAFGSEVALTMPANYVAARSLVGRITQSQLPDDTTIQQHS